MPDDRSPVERESTLHQNLPPVPVVKKAEEDDEHTGGPPPADR
jgi:hypothetical protein